MYVCMCFWCLYCSHKTCQTLEKLLAFLGHFTLHTPDTWFIVTVCYVSILTVVFFVFSCCVDLQYNVSVKNGWKLHDKSQDKWFLFFSKTPAERERWVRAFAQERRQVKEDQENGESHRANWSTNILGEIAFPHILYFVQDYLGSCLVCVCIEPPEICVKEKIPHFTAACKHSSVS